MSLQFSLKPPLLSSSSSSSKPVSLSSSFIHDSFSLLSLSQPAKLTSQWPPSTSSYPVIQAKKVMLGRVVCSASDKTVSVEVTRMAPHPKYKRRVKKKKKFQAHDPDNRFEVGDWVQLEKCSPISKNKTFIAVPAPTRPVRSSPDAAPSELGLPLESESPAAAVAM